MDFTRRSFLATVGALSVLGSDEELRGQTLVVTHLEDANLEDSSHKLHRFLKDQQKRLGLQNWMSWPGFTTANREERIAYLNKIISDGRPFHDLRNQEVLWKLYYESGETSEPPEPAYLKLDPERQQLLDAFKAEQQALHPKTFQDDYGPFWPGWTVKERLSHIMAYNGIIQRGTTKMKTDEWTKWQEFWIRTPGYELEDLEQYLGYMESRYTEITANSVYSITCAVDGPGLTAASTPVHHKFVGRNAKA